MNRRTKVQVYEFFGKIPSVWEVAVVAGLGIAVIGLLGAIALGLNLVLGIFIR